MTSYCTKSFGLRVSSTTQKPTNSPPLPSLSAVSWITGPNDDGRHMTMTLHPHRRTPLLEESVCCYKRATLILNTNGPGPGSKSLPEIAHRLTVMGLMRSQDWSQNTFEQGGISCPCENAALISSSLIFCPTCDLSGLIKTPKCICNRMGTVRHDVRIK